MLIESGGQINPRIGDCTHKPTDRYVTADGLAARGLSPGDVRRRWPLSVERIGLAGESVYDLDDLDGLTAGRVPE